MKQFLLNDISSDTQRENIIASLCKDDTVDISISYISDFINSKVLREFVDKLCIDYGISPKWRTRLVLIIDELNNNAIEYGSKHGDINILHLEFSRPTENTFHVRSSVSDTGKGSHAKTSIEMEKIREGHKKKDFSQHQSIRGRGLFLIIEHLVDTLNFKDSGNGGLIVEIEKNLTQGE